MLLLPRTFRGRSSAKEDESLEFFFHFGGKFYRPQRLELGLCVGSCWLRASELFSVRERLIRAKPFHTISEVFEKALELDHPP